MKKTFLLFFFVIVLSSFVSALSIDTNTKGPLPSFFSAYLTNGTSVNLIGDYSDNQQYFYYKPGNGSVIRVSRMLISLVDVGIDNADEYGGGTALSKGLAFYINESGNFRRIDSGLNTTRNWNYHRLAYDVDEESGSLANGEDTLNIRWTFANSGTHLRLNGSSNDGIFIRVNDNIAIDGQYIKIQGYNETSDSIGVGRISDEEVNRMGWQTAVIIMYVLAVGIYLGTGFVIRNKTIQELNVGDKILKKEIFVKSLTAIKYLYILTTPALVILGVHIAREMALGSGAPINVTNSLTTLMQVLMGSYVIGLLIFFILLIKNSLVIFASAAMMPTSAFRSKRKKRFE